MPDQGRIKMVVLMVRDKDDKKFRRGKRSNYQRREEGKIKRNRKRNESEQS